MPHRKAQPSPFDRRRFLQHTWSTVAASLSLAMLPGRELFAARSLGDSPFTLGVASGEPTPDGIVLWTRLAPDPTDPAVLGRRAIPVGWRVATDPGMRQVVARGTASAMADLAHSVHVEVDGLRPRRDYFYQFDLRQEDDRQYRTDNPCGDGESLRCEEARSGIYTMLGREQERWLSRGLDRSQAAWNIVGQQLLLAELEHRTIQPDWFWNDAWDGYPLARQRLLTDVVESSARNPVFLTGDWHSTFVNDLKLDFKATVTPQQMRLDLRFVTSVENSGGTGYPAGSWVVDDGIAGARPA